MPGLHFRWWAARANRIEEASHRLETSSKELRMSKNKAYVQVDLREEMLRVSASGSDALISSWG